jgi:ubiquinone/menaquinone biosynthesis C-methylase UbiE
MNHRDHVNLIRNGIAGPGGVWAEFGSGDGAFTLALAELLGPGGEIYSVDKNGRSLKQQQKILARSFPKVSINYYTADFRDQLNFLPPLDGLLMANSLHFVDNKEAVLNLARGYLATDGRFLIVEYDTDRGNHWVPYPLSFSRWQTLARRAGFDHTELLQTHPSRFLGGFYAALST